ncbi:MAG: hypothetical protein AB1831_16175 [Pseudomonadota bacterium]
MSALPFKETPFGLSNTNGKMQFVRLLVALLVMSLAAALYTREKIDAENFALGKENVHATEQYRGVAFTGSTIDAIKSIVDRDGTCLDGQAKRVMWLGNSQLHTVNQYHHGQHLAPYWVRESAKDPNCFWPHGLSLPNANLQEYLALTAYVTSATRIDAAVLSLVFDDLREDGLRADFSAMMTDPMRMKLAASEVGRDILARFEMDRARAQGGLEENQGLEGFVQKRFEDSLTDALGQFVPLWAERPNLRAHLMTDLYYLRNFVLRIQPTSVRKQIPARQARNMAALEATLRQLRSQGVPIILYIAPIRQDISLPYDLAEYSRWKKSVAALAAQYDAQLLNLEAIVPARLWGTYHADDVDFMHFQGEGHRLLAQALAPALRQAMGEF